jgi:hypothetical protein
MQEFLRQVLSMTPADMLSGFRDGERRCDAREPESYGGDLSSRALVDRLDRGSANCRGRTREKLLETLRIMLKEALELNPREACATAGGGFEEIPIAV